MKKGKRILICTAKVLLLVIPLMIAIPFLTTVTINKEDIWHVPLIEEAPNGSYDVIMVGPSHMMYTVQPAQLYGEQGIASCNLGTPAQPVPASYYLAKEMIERHDPKVVVLEIFCTVNKETYPDPIRVHHVWDFFPLNENKFQVIENLVEKNKEEFYFPLILFHGRWKELIREDYMFRNSSFNENYLFLDGVTPYPGPFNLLPEEDTLPIPELPLEYLKKLAQLCKETDTKLLLTVMPYRADLDEDSFIQQRTFNAVGALAKELDVDFLNTLQHLDEIGLDFTTDMFENSHVNHSGGEKISRYFGQYLRDHYDLPDRSQDADYDHWKDDYASYLDELAYRYGQY